MNRLDNATELSRRVQSIISETHNDVRSFANKCGISPAYLKRWIGKGMVSLDWIVKILAAFPDVSAEWLMRGDGDMMTKSEYVSDDEIQDVGWYRRRLSNLQSHHKKEMDEKNRQIDALLRTIQEISASIGKPN